MWMGTPLVLVLTLVVGPARVYGQPPAADIQKVQAVLTATTYTNGKSIVTAIAARKIPLSTCATGLGFSIHAGRPPAPASRLSSAVATSVDSFFAKALGASVGDHDQEGADNAAHEADGGRKAPVAALNTAEVDERVQDLSGLRAQ